MKELLERLEDATARLDQVISIAGAIGGGCDAISDPLSELLEEDDDTLRKCFGKLPEWLTEELDGGDAAGAFAEWALKENKLGFAVQIATPEMEHHGDSSSFSWGYYRTRWVYGDTFEAAVDAGLIWVADERKREKKKASEALRRAKRPNAQSKPPAESGSA